jgi:hypothetical protein
MLLKIVIRNYSSLQQFQIPHLKPESVSETKEPKAGSKDHYIMHEQLLQKSTLKRNKRPKFYGIKIMLILFRKRNTCELF